MFDGSRACSGEMSYDIGAAQTVWVNSSNDSPLRRRCDIVAARSCEAATKRGTQIAQYRRANNRHATALKSFLAASLTQTRTMTRPKSGSWQGRKLCRTVGSSIRAQILRANLAFNNSVHWKKPRRSLKRQHLVGRAARHDAKPKGGKTPFRL